MPRRSTHLGMFLKEARLRLQPLKLQKDIANDVGVSIQLVSAWESGTQQPSVGRGKVKLEEVAKAYGVDTEVLKNLVSAAGDAREGRSPSLSTPGQLRIGFVHNVWASPTILLLDLKERMGDLALTSYGRSDAGYRGSLIEPQFYDAASFRKFGYFQSGPIFGKKRGPAIDLLKSSEPNQSLHPYTIDDLLALMFSQEPMLDGLVGASDQMKHHEEQLVRCARIMHSYGGCSFLIATTREQLKNRTGQDYRAATRPNSELTGLDQVMFRSLAQKHVLPVVYQPGTVTASHLKLLRDDLGHQKLKSIEADFSFWVAPKPNSPQPSTQQLPPSGTSVEEKLASALKQHSIVAFLAWEPQVSWFKDWVESQEAVPDAVCLGPANTRSLLHYTKSLPYTTFDVVFRRDILDDSGYRDTIDFFLDQLASRIDELEEKVSDPENYYVKLIAGYLNMDSEPCSSALSGLSFELLYHRAWLKLVQKGGRL